MFRVRQNLLLFKYNHTLAFSPRNDKHTHTDEQAARVREESASISLFTVDLNTHMVDCTWCRRRELNRVRNDKWFGYRFIERPLFLAFVLAYHVHAHTKAWSRDFSTHWKPNPLERLSIFMVSRETETESVKRDCVPECRCSLSIKHITFQPTFSIARDSELYTFGKRSRQKKIDERFQLTKKTVEQTAHTYTHLFDHLILTLPKIRLCSSSFYWIASILLEIVCAYTRFFSRKFRLRKKEKKKKKQLCIYHI